MAPVVAPRVDHPSGKVGEFPPLLLRRQELLILASHSDSSYKSDTDEGCFLKLTQYRPQADALSGVNLHQSKQQDHVCTAET